MPRSYVALLAHADVPARKPLQEAITSLKFNLVFDGDYVPFETTGYLPCTFDGEDAGFNLKF